MEQPEFDHTRQWVIWNGFYGLITFVTLGDIEEDDDGHWGWLDEPFDMVGPLDLDELQSTGSVSFEECLVMSPQRWQRDEMHLRREGMKKRQAAEEMLKGRAHFGRDQSEQPSPRNVIDDKPYRQTLKLPEHGPLKPLQIKSAFRKLAQKLHPDAGGSNEQFQKITAARDHLLARVA